MSRFVEWSTVEVEELPQGAVVVDAAGRAYVRRGKTWDVTGTTGTVTAWGMEYPVLVCHMPPETPREVELEKDDEHRRHAAAAALADFDVDEESLQLRCYPDRGWEWANLLQAVEYDRQRLIALVTRCRKAIRDAAHALDRQEGSSWADAVDQAAGILSQASEGRYGLVSTREELAALPPGTVVVDGRGWVKEIYAADSEYVAVGMEGGRSIELIDLPQTVVWERP